VSRPRYGIFDYFVCVCLASATVCHRYSHIPTIWIFPCHCRGVVVECMTQIAFAQQLLPLPMLVSNLWVMLRTCVRVTTNSGALRVPHPTIVTTCSNPVASQPVRHGKGPNVSSTSRQEGNPSPAQCATRVQATRVRECAVDPPDSG